VRSFFGRTIRAFSLVAALAGAGLEAQTLELRWGATAQLPSPTDSNSPGHWWNGSFVLFNAMGTPYRSQGADQYSLANSAEVAFGPGQPAPLWIEATWIDADGTLYAWYHHEPDDVCPGGNLTAPKIGALVSHDNGVSFQDLGFVLESGDPIDCSAQNGYFAGGNGDFTVIPDAANQYFYFVYSNYGGDDSTEGIAVARMAFGDRLNPVGTVWKYSSGGFTEPGIGGHVTPVMPANVSRSSPNTDAYWGPSVHWNTALNEYVMLLNHSCCSPYFPQEGVYLSVNPDISDASGWSQPEKILDPHAWYPQVLGEGPGETDKVAGEYSRLYVDGMSYLELAVSNDPPPTESDPDPQLIRISPRVNLRLPPPAPPSQTAPRSF
jgi:hypothetical protein